MRVRTVYFSLAFFAAIGRNATAQSLELLAGGLGGFGSADATSVDARFYSPQSVALDSMGNLYVADTKNSTIRKIVTASGEVSTLAGAAGIAGSIDGTGANARFAFPGGIATDCSGNLYVADTFNSTIRRIVTATGEVTTLAGTAGMTGRSDGVGAAARFDYPQGITADCTGNVYVADTFNSTIRRILVATQEVTTLAGAAGQVGSTDGPGPSARFNFPRGVVSDRAGKLYVADTDNFTVRQIDSMATVVTIAGTPGIRDIRDGVGAAAGFFSPVALASDGVGNVYVADTFASTIRKIVVATQAVTTVAGSPTQIGSADGVGMAARFNFPEGVAADSMGNLYVADTNNATIRTIDATGAVATVAGTPTQFGSTDGVGAAARLHFPQGLGTDSAGNLYVADTDSTTVRRIVIETGEVTTLAGTANRSGSTDGVAGDARFSFPASVAVDSMGNLYVADTENSTIRKIVIATREVTTLAGAAGMTGSTDGVGAAARFFRPVGITADNAGTVYVADRGNSTIRKIAVATREVTTVAGSADQVGSTDGTGTAARFNNPFGVALDAAGSLYVADTGNCMIRRIDLSTSAVTTVAGAAGQIGSADGTGMAARFNFPEAVAADGIGNFYIADTFNSTIRKLELASRRVTTIAGSPGVGRVRLGSLPAGLAFPSALTVTSSGDLVISDSGENVILLIRSVAAARTRSHLLTEQIKRAWNSLKGALRRLAVEPRLRVASDKTIDTAIVDPFEITDKVSAPADKQLWSTSALTVRQSNLDAASTCGGNWGRCIDDAGEAYRREKQRCRQMGVTNPLGSLLCYEDAERNKNRDIAHCKERVCDPGQDCHSVPGGRFSDAVCCSVTADACYGGACCLPGRQCCADGCRRNCCVECPACPVTCCVCQGIPTGQCVGSPADCSPDLCIILDCSR